MGIPGMHGHRWHAWALLACPGAHVHSGTHGRIPDMTACILSAAGATQAEPKARPGLLKAPHPLLAASGISRTGEREGSQARRALWNQPPGHRGREVAEAEGALWR